MSISAVVGLVPFYDKLQKNEGIGFFLWEGSPFYVELEIKVLHPFSIPQPAELVQEKDMQPSSMKTTLALL